MSNENYVSEQKRKRDGPQSIPKSNKKRSSLEAAPRAEDSEDEGHDSAQEQTLEDLFEDGYLALSPAKRLTVRKWNNQVLIDIREYYQANDGEMRPGKKGISLTTSQWEVVSSCINAINWQIEKTR